MIADQAAQTHSLKHINAQDHDVPAQLTLRCISLLELPLRHVINGPNESIYQWGFCSQTEAETSSLAEGQGSSPGVACGTEETAPIKYQRRHGGGGSKPAGRLPAWVKNPSYLIQ